MQDMTPTDYIKELVEKLVELARENERLKMELESLKADKTE